MVSKREETKKMKEELIKILFDLKKAGYTDIELSKITGVARQRFCGLRCKKMNYYISGGIIKEMLSELKISLKK